MNGERCRQSPATHGDRCFCGRRARWHVDCSIVGCANLCGIHARAVQRRSLYSAVFNNIIIRPKESPMPVQLDADVRDRLERLADEIANAMARQYGRARVSNPHYSAADLGHGGWSVLVVGMSDDIERQPVRVFADGSTSETDAPAFREQVLR